MAAEGVLSIDEDVVEDRTLAGLGRTVTVILGRAELKHRIARS